MSAERLTLALPIDTALLFDSTVTQTQLSNDTLLGSANDRDVLSGYLEDAEGEWLNKTNESFQESRAGVEGDRETYPQITYKVSGHNDFKRAYTGVSSMYDAEEVTKDLPDDRILPFDSTEGDEAYIYRGLGGSSSGDEWDDVTSDINDTWGIVNHRTGTIAFSPVELVRAMRATASGVGFSRGRLRHLRFAISYRYGTLGGSRGGAGATTLGTSLTTGDTGSTSVSDASRLPDAGGIGGSLILLIGEEYVRATVDATNDTIDIIERGVRGTDAASHSSGDRVQYTPPSVRKAVAARAGMTLVQSGRYQSFLPDSEDAIDRESLLSEMREIWEGTVSAAQ